MLKKIHNKHSRNILNWFNSRIANIIYASNIVKFRRKIWLYFSDHPSLKRSLSYIHRFIERSESLLLIVTLISLIFLIFDASFLFEKNIFSLLHYAVLFGVSFSWLIKISFTRTSFDVDALNSIVSKVDSKEWFRNARSGKLARIHMEGGYEEATSINIHRINRLNTKLFKNTVFESSKKTTNQRNIKIFEQNEKCFRLIKSPIDGIREVGFTHVMPLNEAGTAAYISGGVKDADFRKEYVTSPTEKSNCILIFSMAHKNEYRGLASREFMKVFLLHVIDHITDLVEEMDDFDESAKLILQVGSRDIKTAVESLGFRPLISPFEGENFAVKSGDGHPIYSTHFSDFLDLIS